MAALLLSCGLSWAQTTDVLDHDLIGVNGTSYSNWSGKTSNSDAVYAGNTAGGNDAIQMRSNNNNSGIVTTASGGVVTNITVVWNENTTAGRTLNVYGKNAAYSAASDLYGNNAGTLIGTIVEGVSTELDIDDEYAFIGIRSNSGALYLDEVSITWSEGSGVTPPSIEASNVEIAYDATEGAIAYTINNPVDGGELTAATEAEWLTVGTVGETVPFTCTVNEDGAAREAVVTLAYTYGEQAINQAVTVTQAGNPNALDNISDITATGAYAVQGTIVAMSQRGFIVGDGTGYVYYYNTSYDQSAYAIGDMVKLAGNVVVYGGVFEFNNSTTVTPSNSSNYVAEEPTVITGENMDARVASTTPAQLSSYVQYEGTLSVNDTHYNITNIAGATTAIGSISYPLDTEFASLDGKQVRVSGYYVGISSSTYYNTMIGTIEEVTTTDPIITVTPATVEVDAEEHDGTLDLAYENLEISDMTDFDIQYYDAEGEETETPDWIEVLVAEQDPEIGEGYVVSYNMFENEGEARTAYFKVYAMDDEGELVYSNLVTVNQEAPVVPPTGDEYALYTGELVEGDYLIVYGGGAMNTTVESDRLQYEEVVATNDVIITDNVGIIWHIASSGDYWTIYNADADAFAAGTGVKNKAQMLEDGTDDKALWTVSGTETYEFVNKANTVAEVNANLRKNGTYGFACYSTSTGGALSLYKKVEATTETYTLEIKGYAEGSVGGYYLIASPVTVDLTNHDMTTGDIDLYSFDEGEEDEWRNYEAGAFTTLEPGKGYLYAKKATDDNLTYSFELTGVPYNGNGDVELTYTENADFAGFNLIGNPLNTNATLGDMPYYRLNSDGSALNTSTESGQIKVMEGVFVQATAENTTAHFTTAAGSKMISQLNVKVTRNRGAVLDNAIIRFDNGAMLGKFQLNPNSTKVYITEGNEDYAIVRSAAESEMPVSFKAAENGTYTLSVVAENVEMNYLHLIDNMTGTDVDLLATPSYSFEANTTDYANRFRLVFNANGLEENSNFAFFNGSEWVVSNMGDATLQVIDMTGRVISSETVNGNVTFSTNGLTAGVYMMRLVNGNDVKTQKVLVK